MTPHPLTRLWEASGRPAPNWQGKAKAIGHPDQYGVLDVLRSQPETTCLRVRLAWQYTRTDPPPKAALAEGVLL